MLIVIALVAVLAGFVGGWVAHRRLSLDYKRRWLGAMRALEDKQLESADLQTPLAVTAGPAAPRPADTTPYVHGRWALDERHEGTSAVFYAVRIGFDPVKLGATANWQRFKALYRRDRENAQNAIEDMNAKR